MLGVVHRLVLQRVVVPNGQVGERDHDGVQHEGRARVAQHLGYRRAKRLGHHRWAVWPWWIGTPDRSGADGEERGGHHDQREVLDHVVPEEVAVVDPDES